MSLLTVNLDNDDAAQVRSLVQSLIGGMVGVGPVSVSLPESLPMNMERHQDHIELTWQGHIEADIPGPVNPDLIQIRAYEDEAFVDLRISDIRIGYGQ